MLLLALERGELTPQDVRSYLRDTEVPELVDDTLLHVSSIADIARTTPGLWVRGRSIGLERDALPDIVKCNEQRVRFLRALHDARIENSIVSAAEVSTIASVVRSFVHRCLHEGDSTPRGRVPSMDIDERVVAHMSLGRTFGSRPQLDALLALLVAGGSADASLLHGVAATTSGGRMPRNPAALFSYASDVGIVDVDGSRVTLNGEIDRFLRDGITAIRSLLVPLRRFIAESGMSDTTPEPSPPEIPEVSSVLHVRDVDPAPVREEDRPVIRADDSPGETVVPDPVPTGGHPTVSQDVDPMMADWYERREHSRQRRLRRRETVKTKAVTRERRRGVRVFDDESDNGVSVNPRAQTVHLTVDGRQTSDFDFAKDNPAYVESMAQQWAKAKGCSIEEAYVKVLAKLAEQSSVHGSSSVVSHSMVSPPVHTEPIYVPPAVRPTRNDEDRDPHVRMRPMEIEVTDQLRTDGKEELRRMRYVLSQCLSSTGGINTTDFIAHFGPHLLHAARCIADVLALIENKIGNEAVRLEFSTKVANYGLYALAEYVTAAAMKKNNDTPVEWDELPLSRANPGYEAYVVALADEILEKTQSMRGASDDRVRYVACDVFFGEFFSSDANMHFGQHVKSLLSEHSKPIEDDAERSRGLNVFDYVQRFNEADGYVPLNMEGWEPTNTIPGSPERKEALRARIEAGQPLWHDDDRVDFKGFQLRGLFALRDEDGVGSREEEFLIRENLDRVEANRKSRLEHGEDGVLRRKHKKRVVDGDSEKASES